MVQEAEESVDEQTATENQKLQKFGLIIAGLFLLTLILLPLLYEDDNEGGEDKPKKTKTSSSGEVVSVSGFEKSVEDLVDTSGQPKTKTVTVNGQTHEIPLDDAYATKMQELLDKLEYEKRKYDALANAKKEHSTESKKLTVEEKMALNEKIRAYESRVSKKQSLRYPTSEYPEKENKESHDEPDYRQSLSQLTSTDWKGSPDTQLQQLRKQYSVLERLKQDIDKNQQASFSRGTGQLKTSYKPEKIVGYTRSRAEKENLNVEGMVKLPLGTIANAVLSQDVISDYTGPYKGTLTHDVYDANYEYILFPKGTEVIGNTVRVANVNEAIQNRMGMTTTYFVLPNGDKVELKRAAALDKDGIAAIKDEVDYHLMAQFLGVAAYAIVSSGTDSERSSTDSGSVNVRGDVESGFRRQVSPLVQKYLNIVPTIKLNSGKPFKIFFEEEVYVKPWRSIYDDYIQ